MRYAAGNITTVVMFLLAVLTIIVRLKARPQNNWPLIFFGLLFVFGESYPGRVNPGAIYCGLVMTLLLRFEFMSGFFQYAATALEIGAIAVTGYLLLHAVYI
jgi:hypothetical protein